MINKRVLNPAEAIADIADGSSIMIGGFGEFRPLVENGRRGAAANRRVEIRLLPMPVLEIEDVEVVTPDPTPAGASTRPRPAENEPLK